MKRLVLSILVGVIGLLLVWCVNTGRLDPDIGTQRSSPEPGGAQRTVVETAKDGGVEGVGAGRERVSDVCEVTIRTVDFSGAQISGYPFMIRHQRKGGTRDLSLRSVDGRASVILPRDGLVEVYGEGVVQAVGQIAELPAWEATVVVEGLVTVTGKVVRVEDDRESVLPGASVFVAIGVVSEQDAIAVATADADGAFAFHMPIAESYVWASSPDGRASQRVHLDCRSAMTLGPLEPIVLEVRHGSAAISVHVERLPDDGEGVRVRVAAQRLTAGFVLDMAASSNHAALVRSEGIPGTAVDLRGLAPGGYEVCVVITGVAPMTRKVVVRDGETESIRIVDRPALGARVRVLGDDKPIRDAVVCWSDSDWYTTTDADGTAVMDRVRPEPVWDDAAGTSVIGARVRAFHPSFGSGQVLVRHTVTSSEPVLCVLGRTADSAISIRARGGDAGPCDVLVFWRRHTWRLESGSTMPWTMEIACPRDESLKIVVIERQSCRIWLRKDSVVGGMSFDVDLQDGHGGVIVTGLEDLSVPERELCKVYLYDEPKQQRRLLTRERDGWKGVAVPAGEYVLLAACRGRTSRPLGDDVVVVQDGKWLHLRLPRSVPATTGTEVRVVPRDDAVSVSEQLQLDFVPTGHEAAVASTAWARTGTVVRLAPAEYEVVFSMPGWSELGRCRITVTQGTKLVEIGRRECQSLPRVVELVLDGAHERDRVATVVRPDGNELRVDLAARESGQRGRSLLVPGHYRVRALDGRPWNREFFVPVGDDLLSIPLGAR